MFVIYSNLIRMDRRRAVYMSIPSKSGQENLPPMRTATVKAVNRNQLTPQQIQLLQMQKQRMQMQQQQKQKEQQIGARLRQIQVQNQQEQLRQEQLRQEQLKQQIARKQAEQVPDDPILREELLAKLKDKYLEILERLEVPEQFMGGFKVAMEVLKGERETTYGRLLNIEMGLERVVSRCCPTFGMMEECRKAMRKRETREESKKEEPKRVCGVEPWESVKHLEIRVPEAVRKLLQKPISRR